VSRWFVRPEARPAIGAVATGAAAESLVRRMLAADDEVLGLWKGVSVEDGVIILGDQETLPWVEGVRYLSRDERAPQLLLPTLSDPEFPLDLFEQAIVAKSSLQPPLAVFDERVISVSNARQISRVRLRAWLESR
jgi:hypothetical protein